MGYVQPGSAARGGIIRADNPGPLEAGGIVDQQAPAPFQDRVVDRVPGTARAWAIWATLRY